MPFVKSGPSFSAARGMEPSLGASARKHDAGQSDLQSVPAAASLPSVLACLASVLVTARAGLHARPGSGLPASRANLCTSGHR